MRFTFGCRRSACGCARDRSALRSAVLGERRSLREQLSSAGAHGGLAQLGELRGTVAVRPIDTLNRLLEPYRKLIAVAKGSFTIVPGDFAEEHVRLQALARGPFDHVICTDVISPMGTTLSDTTAMLTTGDPTRGASILCGVAEAATAARTLYTGFLLPEQSPECGAEIARAYAVLEGALRVNGRALRFADVFSHHPARSVGRASIT